LGDTAGGAIGAVQYHLQSFRSMPVRTKLSQPFSDDLDIKSGGVREIADTAG
jgi:hypothetical protein